MVKAKLYEADKECVFRQARAGRPIPAIAESFGITQHHVRRIAAQKLANDPIESARRAKCWMCELPPSPGDVFCSKTCESAWNRQTARNYFDSWLSGGEG